MQVPSEGGLRDPGVVRRVRLLDQRAPPQGVQTHLLQLGRVVPRLRVWTVALLREPIQKTSFAIEQIFQQKPPADLVPTVLAAIVPLP